MHAVKDAAVVVLMPVIVHVLIIEVTVAHRYVAQVVYNPAKENVMAIMHIAHINMETLVVQLRGVIPTTAQTVHA